LLYHGGGVKPTLYLLDVYKRFGFRFDHVYAYEMAPTTPDRVFQLVPEELFPNYHWINVGVESDPKGKMNPLRMLLQQYTEEDFVVIKLDIDTSWIELPLVHQLLEDDQYNKLVDQFYFEHHVFQKELQGDWKKTMEGTLKKSLEIFGGLRKKGIAAHYWV
jgi:hypothetical protein